MGGNKKRGRPSKYSKKLGDKICEAIATSNKGLHRLCVANKEFPSFVAVFRWLNHESAEYNDFRKCYASAREAQAELMKDEIVELSDKTDKDSEAYVGGNHVQRARLQVDARKWVAAHLYPKRFGDKIDITTQGEKISQPPLDLSSFSDEELKTFHALSIKATTGSGTK